MIVLFQAKRGEKMKAKNMKAEIVKVIRTDTVEGKGTEESPVCSVRRYWTLEGELISEQILMGGKDPKE